MLLVVVCLLALFLNSVCAAPTPGPLNCAVNEVQPYVDNGDAVILAQGTLVSPILCQDRFWAFQRQHNISVGFEDSIFALTSYVAGPSGNGFPKCLAVKENVYSSSTFDLNPVCNASEPETWSMQFFSANLDHCSNPGYIANFTVASIEDLTYDPACDPVAWSQECAEGYWHPLMYGCCEGFFCPLGTTKMVPCKQGSYCPEGRVLAPKELDSEDWPFEFDFQDNDTTKYLGPYNVALGPFIQCTGARVGDSGEIEPRIMSAHAGCSGTTFDAPCEQGKLCRSTDEQKLCPEGHFCRPGATTPVKCPFMMNCPEGSAVPKLNIAVFLSSAGVIFGAFFVVIKVYLIQQERRKNKSPPALEENVDVCTMFPQTANAREPVSVNFKNLCVTVGNGKQIMTNVSGELKSSQMVALMGPSGAGKSTLMKVLAGRNVAFRNGQPGHGTLTFNRAGKKYGSLRQLAAETGSGSGYVPQDDIMLEQLTAKECLIYVARCRRTNADDIENIVDRILKAVGLYRHRNSPIGNGSQGGLSGGQRKRVNIAMELVHNPSVIFLDEPTSGLDSATSMDITRFLGDLAEKLHTTIIVVLHQPRREIFLAFHKLMLLMRGQVVFDGNPSDCTGFFKSIAPAIKRPATFKETVNLMRQVSYLTKVKAFETKQATTLSRMKSRRRIASRARNSIARNSAAGTAGENGNDIPMSAPTSSGGFLSVVGMARNATKKSSPFDNIFTRTRQATVAVEEARKELDISIENKDAAPSLTSKQQQQQQQQQQEGDGNPADYVFDLMQDFEDKGTYTAGQMHAKFEAWRAEQKNNDASSSDAANKQYKGEDAFVVKHKPACCGIGQWLTQFAVLFYFRALIPYVRMRKEVLTNAMLTGVTAFCLGYFWTSTNMIDVPNSISMVILGNAILGIQLGLTLFSYDALVYWREASYPNFKRSAYWCGKSFMGLFDILFVPAVFVSVYEIFNLTRGNAIDFYLVLVALHFVLQGIGHVISVLFSEQSSKMAGVVISLLAGGVINGYGITEEEFFEKGFPYNRLSPCSYAQEALWKLEADGSSETLALEISSIETHFSYDQSIDELLVILLVYGIIVRVIALLCVVYVHDTDRIKMQIRNMCRRDNNNNNNKNKLIASNYDSTGLSGDMQFEVYDESKDGDQVAAKRGQCGQCFARMTTLCGFNPAPPDLDDSCFVALKTYPADEYDDFKPSVVDRIMQLLEALEFVVFVMSLVAAVMYLDADNDDQVVGVLLLLFWVVTIRYDLIRWRKGAFEISAVLSGHGIFDGPLESPSLAWCVLPGSLLLLSRGCVRAQDKGPWAALKVYPSLWDCLLAEMFLLTLGFGVFFLFTSWQREGEENEEREEEHYRTKMMAPRVQDCILHHIPVLIILFLSHFAQLADVNDEAKLKNTLSISSSYFVVLVSLLVVCIALHVYRFFQSRRPLKGRQGSFDF